MFAPAPSTPEPEPVPVRGPARLSPGQHQPTRRTPTPWQRVTALATLLSALSACGSWPGWRESTPNEPSTASMPGSVASGEAAADGSVQASEAQARAAAALAALPPPATFEEAVNRAGEQLFREAAARLGPEARTVVVDPLIDANTGAQTQGTVGMGEQLVALLKAQQPQWTPQPLSRSALADKPLLLIGTLTPMRSARPTDDDAGADTFRVWLTLIDLREGTIAAKTLDRATAGSVNADPVPYFSDSPTWHKDRTVSAYINACQIDTQPGDPVDPAYLARLPAAAVTQEAISAYNDGRYEAAQSLYREAQAVAEPDDLRVLNGLYLTSWRLGDRDQAAAAFGQIVAAGLQQKKLPVKLLFQPGGTQLLPVPDLRAQYDLWIKEVATQAQASQSCLKVVGHTSRTGSLKGNEALSLRRAAFIEQSLVSAQGRSLGRRLGSDGLGWRDNLVGLGTDDMRDALDRRVEFRVVDCHSLSQRVTVQKDPW